MKIYDTRTLFKAPDANTGALIGFLLALGEQEGRKDTQVVLHACFAVRVHDTYFQRLTL